MPPILPGTTKWGGPWRNGSRRGARPSAPRGFGSFDAMPERALGAPFPNPAGARYARRMGLPLRQLHLVGWLALCAACAGTSGPQAPTAVDGDRPPEVRPFLMFQGGEATAALELYREVFPSFRELSMERYGAEGPGPEGTVFRGEIEIGGQRILVSDSYAPHGFGFTPSLSFWVECAGAAQLDRTYEALVDGGKGSCRPPTTALPLGLLGLPTASVSRGNCTWPRADERAAAAQQGFALASGSNSAKSAPVGSRSIENAPTSGIGMDSISDAAPSRLARAVASAKSATWK